MAKGEDLSINWEIMGDVIYGLPLKARIMGPHKDEPRTKGVSLVFPFCKGMKKVWGGRHVVFYDGPLHLILWDAMVFFWGLLLIYDQETNQRRRRINGDNTFITTQSELPEAAS